MQAQHKMPNISPIQPTIRDIITITICRSILHLIPKCGASQLENISRYPMSHPRCISV